MPIPCSSSLSYSSMRCLLFRCEGWTRGPLLTCEVNVSIECSRATIEQRFQVETRELCEAVPAYSEDPMGYRISIAAKIAYGRSFRKRHLCSCPDHGKSWQLRSNFLAHLQNREAHIPTASTPAARPSIELAWRYATDPYLPPRATPGFRSREDPDEQVRD